VLEHVKDAAATPAPLQGVRLLAAYLADPSRRSALLLALEDWLTDAAAASNATAQLMAATVYTHEGAYGAALKVIKDGASLEQLALASQIYLRMDRADLAERTLKAMQGIDDESTLTQLCAGWLYLAQGGDKYKEASLVFKDLLDRYGDNSATVVNGLAVAYIALRRYDDAGRLLSEALAAAPQHADTLVNLITVCQHTGRGADSYLATLAKVAPSHPYVAGLEAAQAQFDRVAATFK
jgi:coatomer protein complex subunit epsilon